MDNLQKILDEKFPLPSEANQADKNINARDRRIFTEGYNAAHTIPEDLYNALFGLHNCIECEGVASQAVMTNAKLMLDKYFHIL